MPPPLLFDIADLDLDKVQYTVEEIERVNPHRGAMRLLDGVTYMDHGLGRIVAYHDVLGSEFWVEGHIPGRPLMPGVLIIEAAAQTASFLSLTRLGDADFLGFVAADEIKFRGQVEPGDRLVVLEQAIEYRHRRCVCKSQGLVGDRIVFEGTITGMPM